MPCVVQLNGTDLHGSRLALAYVVPVRDESFEDHEDNTREFESIEILSVCLLANIGPLAGV